MNSIVSPDEWINPKKDEWTKPENFPYMFGTGNWEAFQFLELELQDLFEEAKRWGEVLHGVERPWLCWNVDDDWSLVQQRLVQEVGWTPVVGFDPRVGPPPLVPGAILVNFNANLKLPTMWLHFPLEFIHLFCNRLAFWHADCLVRIEKLQKFASMFAELPDGEMAAVLPKEDWRARFSPTARRRRRLWEVVGCSTAGASRSLFEHGCGWWMVFWKHPRTPANERELRSRYHWECGVGVRYWANNFAGKVHTIPEAEIAEGHFTLIGRKDYQRASPRHFKRELSKELSLNNDLVACCEKLDLVQFIN